MENLQITQTKSSPEINFNTETNIHEISGESYPENTAQFYDPILDWINEYLKLEHTETIIFNIELIYFNSSSSKILLDIFDMLDNSGNNNITINWIHDEEDEAMEEYGEEFEEEIEHINFVIKTKEF